MGHIQHFTLYDLGEGLRVPYFHPFLPYSFTILISFRTWPKRFTLYDLGEGLQVPYFHLFLSYSFTLIISFCTWIPLFTFGGLQVPFFTVFFLSTHFFPLFSIGILVCVRIYCIFFFSTPFHFIFPYLSFRLSLSTY